MKKKRKSQPRPFIKPMPKKPAAAIIAEIGQDNFDYIMNHHGKQKRHIIAKKTGILKFNLNQYFIHLFGSEAM